jgi:hypothetical protein
LVYADDVNILGGRAHTVQKNMAALVVAIKEIRLEVNADKIRYMAMSQDKNAGRSRKIKTDNRSIEVLEEVRYLRTT